MDATVIAPPGGFVAANEEIVFQFNTAGQIQPLTGQTAAKIYSNAELNPQLSSTLLGTYYLVTFYDANGARLNKDPMWWQFPEATGATVDISQMIPISTIGGNVIFYPTNFGTNGTVTSVAFVGDGTILSATPSTPVTTSGNVTATLLTQNANLFLAGPASGGAAFPTFRSIIVADMNVATSINSTLLTLNSTHAGPVGQLDAVLKMTNTLGSTPTFFAKDAADNFTISTATAQISETAAGNISLFAGGAGHPSFQMQAAGSIVLGGINTGVISFLENAAGFLSGLNQIEFSMFQTGVGPHGVWFQNAATTAAIFLDTDNGSIYSQSVAGQQAVLTQVSVSGGTTTYIGTFTAATSNLLAGQPFFVTGFTNSGNNIAGGIIITSSATQITVATTTQVNETHAGLAIINANSGAILISGSVWNGSQFVLDTWTIQNIVNPGNLGGQTLSITSNQGNGAVVIGTSFSAGTCNVGPVFTGGNVQLTSAGATGVGNVSSYSFQLESGWWDGALSHFSLTSIQDVEGSGTNPTDTTVISNSGAFAWAGVKVSGPLQFLNSTSGSASYVQSTVVTITSAQIKTLNSVPTQVLPAPGTNKTYLIVGLFGHYVFNTTAYTIGSLGEISLIFNANTASPVFALTSGTGFLDQTHDMYTQGFSDGNDIPASDQVNKAVSVFGAGGNPTLGDGTLRLTIQYVILDTTVS